MKTRILLLLLLSCCMHTLQAQTTISGTVLSEQGDTLAGVNLFIKDALDGSSSDAKGNFSFTTEETGTHILLAKMIGFETVEKEVVLNGTPIKLKLTLSEKAN